ncbi:MULTISPECIES: DUF421 domain-containing protein [unclassified Bacillus (in: firmicutes)]|uniref:YetF domain-containing protein n=1 Tax=unclassified Bacillus (in: firmicutes) TaxID=185979 RepID=UPI001BEB88AB|nr:MULTISPECIES: DUF421 domain-containing protein [unclassified Bacillus (in: firmicutes)]MBT2640582.1 DUF421 domain-containing protein [Bacillus sp. ISL-39]MBT2663482.1 DUF421 domain-containing protein [Bacillus sp. ISL-45]
MNQFEVILRIAIAFIVLLAMARWAGRKEISQMTFFNLVSAIAFGSLAATLALNPSVSILNGIIALFGWAALTVLTDQIHLKSKKARKLLMGDPVIVIKKGKIMEDALRQVRMDADSLQALLRQKSVFSLSDVDYAIFETDGKLSVMKMEGKQTVTKSDMNIAKSSGNFVPLSTELVSDGQVNVQNLNKMNKDRTWLDEQLQQAGVQSLDDVFYAEVQPDGNLYIDKRNDILH